MLVPNPKRPLYKVSREELEDALKKFPLKVIKGNILFYLSGIVFDSDNKSKEKFIKKCFENHISPVTVEYGYSHRNNCFKGIKLRYFFSDYLSEMGVRGLLSGNGIYGQEFIFNKQNPKKEFDVFKNDYLDKVLKNYDIESFNLVFRETVLEGYKSNMKLSCKKNKNNLYELSFFKGKSFQEDLVRNMNKWGEKYFFKKFIL